MARSIVRLTTAYGRDLCSKRERGRPDLRCVPLPTRVTKRPDPYIYSQFYLMDQGMPVTWDNPDVRLLRGGVEAYTYNLEPATTYDLNVTIHNGSPDQWATDTMVRIFWLEFGAGGGVAAYHPISTHRIDIAPRGMPGEPYPILSSWITPSQPGHYCIEVLIENPSDLNVGNNRGWNNTVVKKASAAGQEIEIELPIWNSRLKPGPRGLRRLAFWTSRPKEAQRAWPQEGWLRDPAEITVALDSYILQTRGPDGEAIPAQVVFRKQPAAWNAQLRETRFRLEPGGGPHMAVAVATLPGDIKAGTTQVFNLNVWAGGKPIGGATYRIRVS